jgi:hypothetical protein
MDCAGEVGAEPATSVPVLNASLLLHVRQVHAEFGLKHNDYKRYRCGATVVCASSIVVGVVSWL